MYGSFLHFLIVASGCCCLYCMLCFVASHINWFSWQERQRIIYDEQKKLAQHQAQTKPQMAKYEDELARKRMQVLNLLKLRILIVLFRAVFLILPL